SPSACTRASTTWRSPIPRTPGRRPPGWWPCSGSTRSRASSRSSIRRTGPFRATTRAAMATRPSPSFTPRDAHRRLPRLVRPDHAGARGPDPARPHLPGLQLGARGSPLRRRCVAAGPPRGGSGAQAKVREVTFRDALQERARRRHRRVVLPEGADARVRAAAARIERSGLGSVELLEGIAFRSPLPEMVRLLRDRHPIKFPDDAAAATALAHPLTYDAALVALGRADVMVGGATFPSGDTIRAALWTVGTAPGITTVSGAFYMVKDDVVLTFTDCAVVPEPTSEQLAESALAA